MVFGVEFHKLSPRSNIPKGLFTFYLFTLVHPSSDVILSHTHSYIFFIFRTLFLATSGISIACATIEVSHHLLTCYLVTCNIDMKYTLFKGCHSPCNDWVICNIALTHYIFYHLVPRPVSFWVSKHSMKLQMWICIYTLIWLMQHILDSTATSTSLYWLSYSGGQFYYYLEEFSSWVQM